MPYARFADTARRWASERAVTLWAFFAGDIPPADLEAIAAGAAGAKADSARFDGDTLEIQASGNVRIRLKKQ